MNKQKFLKSLSILGVLFAIYMLVSYFQVAKNRGAVIESQIEVPEAFAQQFSRVLKQNRYSDMKTATFMSPEDNRVNWQVFNGKYLLVNFWATWCSPCVLELPSLDKLQNRYKDSGLEVIAISMDVNRPHDDIKAFLRNRGIGQFAAYFDDTGEVKDNIYMRGIPTSYLLDPAGRVLYIFEGDANWSSSSAINFFESILNNKTE